METRADNVRAIALTVLLHAGLLAFLILSALFSFSEEATSAAGEPIQATLQFSAADIRRAQQAVKHSPPTPDEPESAPPPQPEPSPRPQDSDTPLQPTPQAPQDRPDTVDQEAIDRNALLKAEQEKAEQEERTRQEQVDLTEDIERQQEAERRQRLLAYQDVQRQREAAERRTRMEEQRLQQLADLKPSDPPPRPGRVTEALQGDRGRDESLLARYKAAMLQTADQNWNHLGAPELTVCKVRFSQIPGGDVTNVEFISCPYDAEGREFVERALRKGMMPYAGFESVFMPKVELSFCYPREDCAR